MSGGAPVVVIEAPGRSPLHVVVVDRVEVGRSCPGVNLDDPAISRRHLELARVDDAVMVRDLESANGTTVDGVRIADPVALTPGRVVQLGAATIRLHGSVPDAPTAPADAEVPVTSIERVAAAVVAEGSEVAPRAGATTSIVFSDIESSTDLAVSMGDLEWFAVLEHHNQILRGCLDRHDGHEVKSQGDGFMLTFPSARSSVAYMVDIQRELGADPRMTSAGLRVRIGGHTGEALHTDDGDLFGRAVIAAARIGAAARGGEILVSSLVREIVESWDEFTFGTPRSLELKGLGREWTLHPVEWDRS